MRGKLFAMILLSVSGVAVLPAANAFAQYNPAYQRAMQMAAYQQQMQLAAQQRAWQIAAMQNAQRVAVYQQQAQLLMRQQQAAYIKQQGLRPNTPVPIQQLPITAQDRALAAKMNAQLPYMTQLAQQEAKITGKYMSVSQVPGYAAWNKMTGFSAFTGRTNTGFFSLGSAHASGGGGGCCDASGCSDGGGGDGGGGGGGGGCGGGDGGDDSAGL
jgi:hypothetical protein